MTAFSATPGASSPAVRARLACSAVFLLNGFGCATWASRIPDIQRQHGLTEARLGWALLCIAAGALVGIPAAGRALARLPSRVVCGLFGALFIASLCGLALVPGVWLLVAALVVFGFGNGGLDVAMNAQAVEIERTYGRPIMSGFHALWSTGGLTGALCAGWLVGCGLPHPTHLFVTGLVLALGILPATFLMLSSPPAEPSPEVKAASAKPRPLGPTLRLGQIGLIAFCALVAEGAVADWSTLYLRKALGTSAGFAVYGYAAFQAAMASMRFAGDRVTALRGPVWVVRTGGVVAAAGFGVALLVGAPWAALLGFGCIGLGMATVFPVVMSAAGRLRDLPSGSAIALVAGFAYTGFLAGPPIIGFLAERTGFAVALGTVVVATVIIALLAPAAREEQASPARAR